MIGSVGADLGGWVMGGAAVLVSIVFGVPAWRIARRREREEEIHELAGAVAKVLTGTDDPKKMGAPSKDNPSIRELMADLLGESAATTSEVAIVREILNYHLADKHGGPIPDYLLRK